MSIRRVLYLTYDGLLEPLGRSQVVPVVEGLAGEGFRMEVVSFEKPEDLAREEELDRMRGRLEEAGVTWRPQRYHARPSVPATAYDIWRGTREVRRAVGEAKGKLLVHARSYVPALMALRGLPSQGSRLLFDMRGFWVDERIEAGRWRDGTLLVAEARRREKDLLAGAHHLVHLTRAGMEGVTRLSRDGKVPHGTVIPTLVDMDVFHPGEDKAGLRRSLGLGGGPVFIHTGTLSGWYLGEKTFQLAKVLTDRTGGAFVVLTRETELAGQLARYAGVEARVLAVDHGEVPLWLQAADLGLALVRPGFSKRASAPTKIGEYLASGLIAVGTEGVGDLTEQFLDSRVAFAISPDAPVEETAASLLDGLQRDGREGEARSLAARHFDLGAGIRAYAEVYRGLGVLD